VHGGTAGFVNALAEQLGDDAAVLAPPPGRELVLAADAMVAGVHFLPDDPAETIGRKLLRTNLNEDVLVSNNGRGGNRAKDVSKKAIGAAPAAPAARPATSDPFGALK
jgi:hypothetical protein